MPAGAFVKFSCATRAGLLRLGIAKTQASSSPSGERDTVAGRGQALKAKAAVLVGDNNIEIRELDVPVDPPPGGAILAVEGCGMCGSAIKQYHGGTARRSEERRVGKAWVST